MEERPSSSILDPTYNKIEWSAMAYLACSGQCEECSEKVRSLKDNYHVKAEGNLVLSATEGYVGTQRAAFYDLFRIEKNKIVEHWDIIAPIDKFINLSNERGSKLIIEKSLMSKTQDLTFHSSFQNKAPSK